MLTRTCNATLLLTIGCSSLGVAGAAKPTKSPFFLRAKPLIEKGRILERNQLQQIKDLSIFLNDGDLCGTSSFKGNRALWNVRGGGIVEKIPTELKTPGNIGLTVAAAGTIHAALVSLWPTSAADSAATKSSSSINYFIRVTGMIRTFYLITLIGSVFVNRITFIATMTTNMAVGIGLVPLILFHVVSVLSGQPQKIGVSFSSIFVNMMVNSFCCYTFLTNAPYSDTVLKLFAGWNLLLGVALTFATEKSMKFRGLDFLSSSVELKSVLKKNVGIHTLFASFLLLALSEYSGEKGDLITAFAVFFVPLKKRHDNVNVNVNVNVTEKQKEGVVFKQEPVVNVNKENSSVITTRAEPLETLENNGTALVEEDHSKDQVVRDERASSSLGSNDPLADQLGNVECVVNYTEYVNYTQPSTGAPK
eukprot:CAMPEP_0195285048 /NCGR_PEP_ID=MMETSP0707-20130614/3021_1 /TAXON_ID=33640 /ORGANISM="Asterionellopsis glacialis, Strain CCMP134" /LENGTH=419 /DNA_ID=CAMNT_0040344479 /DNA_START=56 /DNA_END=1315 /DNA_ORIENTATION=+